MLRINPSPFHQDPLGVYFFPSRFKIPAQMWKQRKYLFTVRLRPGARVLDYGSISDDDLMWLLERTGGLKSFEWTRENYPSETRQRELKTAWDCMKQGLMFGEAAVGAFRARWNKLLRERGFDAVFDDTGSILSNEIQLLVLNPRVIDIVSMEPLRRNAFEAIQKVMQDVAGLCAPYGDVTITPPRMTSDSWLGAQKVLSGRVDVHRSDDEYASFRITYNRNDRTRVNIIDVSLIYSQPSLGYGSGATFNIDDPQPNYLDDIARSLARIFEPAAEDAPLREAVDVGSAAFQNWFAGSKVVGPQGQPLPVYHGTARPDRVGNRFRKARATAGPMAFFTDDPTIASSYASTKADTSIEDDGDYAEWFKVKVPEFRNPINIVRAWHFLPAHERQTIAALAPRVTQDDAGAIFRAGPDEQDGNGNYQEFLKRARGNALQALVEGWLASGTLYNNEIEFLRVLRLAGCQQDVIYDDPAAAYPFVYQVYLAIRNPLDTSHIPAAVLTALERAASRQRQTSSSSFASWDKSTTPASAWIEELRRDQKNGTAMAWTVVPDWATKVLKSFGYDGIKDTGGKHGGTVHTVWIPFDDKQVKSAISNTRFNPAKASIHERARD